MSPDRKKWTRDDYATMIGLTGTKKKAKSRMAKRRKGPPPLHKRNLVMRGRGGLGGIPIQGGGGANFMNDFLLAAALTKVSGKLKVAMIENMSNRQINAIGEILRAYMSSRVKLPQRVVDQLKKDRRYINALIKKGRNRAPPHLRRAVIGQRGGILGAILPMAVKAIAPAIGGLLSKIF